MKETNWEHYQDKIIEFINTTDCSNCHFSSKCNRDYRGASCVFTPLIWAIREYSEPEKEYDFEPFEQVITRQDDSCIWHCDIYKSASKKRKPYVCIGGTWNQCLPYKGNESLLGTTDKKHE